jgi:hypothetical protein
MDPTKELSAIIGDLGVQIAYLQAQVRLLNQENAALKQQLENAGLAKEAARG